MNQNRKMARDILKRANKEQFETLLDGANLTPFQEDVIRKRIAKDMTICKISMISNCSESLVKKRLAEALDKVSTLFVLFVSFQTAIA